jgi:hypothetical protein
VSIHFHNPPDAFELKFSPVPALDLARVEPMDPDDPFPPAPVRPLTRLNKMLVPTGRPRHRASRMAPRGRWVIIFSLLFAAVALVLLMAVALIAGRHPLPTTPGGGVGSTLPAPSPLPYS